MNKNIQYGFYNTPFGQVIAAQRARRIVYLAFVMGTKDDAIQEMKQRIGSNNGPSFELIKENQALTDIINAFIEGEHIAPPKIKAQGTQFQETVWKALLTIPRGKTVSYKDIATRIGKPKASRAVGGAVGANPISLFIPCHRVLASDGSIGGYAWGVERKQQILASEGV